MCVGETRPEGRRLLAERRAMEAGNDERYSVSLEGEATLFNDAKARVVLFGINSTFVDQPGTLIDEIILAVTDLPVLYELDWPKDAHTLIQNPPVTDPSNARYSLFVTIDVDGDGMMCQGDLRRDYDVSPNVSFSARPTGTTTIVMTEQEVDFCRQFSVSIPVEL